MNQKSTAFLRTLSLVLLGNTVIALALVVFVLPNRLITGGATGIALFFYHNFGVPVTLFVSAFNLLMFLLGLVTLGKTFALTTLVSSFYYPLILGLLQRVTALQGIIDDLLLSALYGGLLMGLGLGIVIHAGASTGGMDIPPLLINKKWGIPVAAAMYGFDLIILSMQSFFTDKERVLYGLLLVLIYTATLDKVLFSGLSRTQVKVISERYVEINEAILNQLDRGCTLIQSETGYRHEPGFLVLTVIANRELPKLNRLVQSIDPKAFMVINRVNEVKGRGFSLSREYPSNV